MSIEELETYFEGIDLPETVYLNPAIKITDVKKFVRSHIITVKAHGHIRAYSSFMDRLLQLKEIIEAGNAPKTTDQSSM
ncbi:DUF6965 family protein [Pedobacter nutrimenti]|jgi:hypothetical protein|uniref:DUF6965 domain-containing protein n=1 Tax=Pedobacter nutrimenti TaxID=1241337 RepID=A0A318U7N7_9SPHI|nr:hypothetical protein [Pedobacter nutrimenti]PYF69519.1 hypothetical protein B0O44_110159 [Pedobacter nutrimenti]